MALAKVATRAAVRLAESWRDDLRDVRCKMEEGRGLTGVGSLVFEHELNELNELGKRMRLTLNHCCIADVEMQEPKPTDNQRKGRRVYINIDEEDFFEMLDHVNPKNIIKYLDMRRIPHRDSLEINVSEVKVNLNHSKHIDRVKHGLYQANVTNRKKLNRALELLDNLKTEGKA